MKRRRGFVPLLLAALGALLAADARVGAAALDPALSWFRVYNGSGNAAEDNARVALGTDGSVYLAGSVRNSGSYDISIRRVNAAGDMLTGWPVTFDGAGAGVDRVYAAAVDPAGNICVAGESSNGSNADAVVLKYDPDGIPVSGWPKLYAGGANGLDVFQSLAFDEDGNVFAAGYTQTASSIDYLVLGFSPDGSVLPGWPKTFNGSGSGDDRAVAVAVDGDGNVYVAGTARTTTDDVVVLKYGPDGTAAAGWPKTYNGTGNGAEAATALALGADGSVHVTAQSSNGTNEDFVVLKYQPDGSVPTGWPQRYNGSFNADDVPRAVAVTAAGEVYVTGRSSNGSNLDALTLKYDKDGAVVSGWPQRWNSVNNRNDAGEALALDPDGNLFVTGYTFAGTTSDVLILRYGPAGGTPWSDAWDHPDVAVRNDAAASIAVDSGGSAYVAGIATLANADLLLMRYRVEHTPEASDSTVEVDEGQPRSITLQATDRDGDALTYRLTRLPDHGDLTGTAPDLTYTPDAGYYGPDSLQFVAEDAANSSGPATVSIIVTPVTPASINLSRASVPGGAQVAAVVSISRAAPAGGITINVDSTEPGAAAVPASVMVEAGKTTAAFPVNTAGVAANVAAAISAGRAGVTKSAALTVEKAALTQFALRNRNTLEEGTVDGFVVLSAHAPPGGAKIALSNPDGALDAPAEVLVAQNTRKAFFSVTGRHVPSAVAATLRGTYDGTEKTAALGVSPLLSGLSSPSEVASGRSIWIWVTLSAPAPVGGIPVTLESGDPTSLPVPSSVRVAAGKRSAGVEVTGGSPAGKVAVTVTAGLRDARVERVINVEGPVLKNLASFATLRGGRSVNARVALEGFAPPGGVEVTLESDDPALAAVPATVTVPAGTSSLAFPVAYARVAAQRTVTLKATLNGQEKSVTVTVTP